MCVLQVPDSNVKFFIQLYERRGLCMGALSYNCKGGLHSKSELSLYITMLYVD